MRGPASIRGPASVRSFTVNIACFHLLYSLSLRFNGHFPGEPGLAGAYWSKGWWKWWWQQELQVPSCCPTDSVKALKGTISHSMDLLTPNSSEGLTTLSLTTNSSWLPWGRVASFAMPFISPLMPVPLFSYCVTCVKYLMAYMTLFGSQGTVSAEAEAPKRGGYRQPNNNICLHD